MKNGTIPNSDLFCNKEGKDISAERVLGGWKLRISTYQQFSEIFF